MDTLTTVNNQQTTVNTLGKLVKWFLIANASQTRVFKGKEEKIYSYKKLLQSVPFADLPEVVKDELTDYLKKHFDIVDVSVIPVAFDKNQRLLDTTTENDANIQQYGNFMLDVQITVITKDGVTYTLKEAIKTNAEQDDLFRVNTF